jgi:ABC-type Fe3+/spermidine/putrescine transport system ATPase subunit
MSTATLRCTDLRKTYPGQDEPALGDERAGVSFDVSKGELFALLGPSGCGKTTTLRIVGGFVAPDEGTVEIEERDVTRSQPYARRTNTVFQSYALFPHMTLGANVAFGLKMEKVGKAERDRRVDESLELVGLGGMAKRRVTELSGGQQQRAALARAIVKRPAVLLLDEPLGALDLKLRKQMQDELVHLKRETGTTFVHVTHDQEEACAIADRIAVMSNGHIVQIDTPIALYRNPRTAYVASFIHAGTLVRGRSRRVGDQLEVAGPGFAVRGQAPVWANGSATPVALLPHDRVRVAPGDGAAPAGDGLQSVRGRLDRIIFTGTGFDVCALLGEDFEVRAAMKARELPAADQERLVPGAPVDVTWATDDVVFVQEDEA